MSNKPPAITVVVTVLNEASTIVELLDALAQQTLRPTEVYITDGGSTDDTISLINAWSTAHSKTLSVRYKVIAGNRSQGRNAAITMAKTEWIAITDAGCVPTAQWLAELAKEADKLTKKTSEQAIVVAGYYDAISSTALEAAIVPYTLVMPDQVNPAAFLPATRSMLLHKKAWQLVGGFDEALNDNEDYAFAKKIAANRAIKLGFTAAAKVSWRPRSTVSAAAWMWFRFARGDVRAGIIRPKVLLLFGRYVVLIAVSAILLWQQHLSWLAMLWLVGTIGYSSWAVAKNYRYAKKGWYWLPLLQVVADGSVILGSCAGAVQLLTAKFKL